MGVLRLFKANLMGGRQNQTERRLSQRNLHTRALFAGLSLCLIIAGPPAFSAPDLKAVQPRLEVNGNELVVLPPADHHFNLEAPNTVKWGKEKLKIQESEAQIQAELPGKMGVASGKVFICDTKKTYCVDRNFTYTHRPGRTKGAASSAVIGGPSAAQGAESEVKKYYDKVTGFYVNQIDEAFAEAKKKQKPILIDFYGIWCPPCNQLDYQVFSDPGFQDFLKQHYVALKLDSDASISKELMNRYRIKYFPTMVVTTFDGDEITRIIGFREKGALTVALAQAHRLRDKSQKVLQAEAAKGDDQAKIALGELHLEKLEFSEADQWLSPFEKQWRREKSPLLEKIHRTRYGKASSTPEKIDAAEEWLEEFPESVHALLIYDELSDLYAEAKKERKQKAILEKAIEVGNKWKKRPAANFVGTDFTLGDLHTMLAGWHEKLGQKDLATASYLECNGHYLTVMKGKSGFGRGEELNRAYCLRKAGKIEEAKKIYEQGMKLYPKDFTFFLGMGRMLSDDLKNYSEAERYFRQALEKAYGNQRLRTVLLLSQALEKQDRPNEGLRVILNEMASVADPKERSYQRLKKRFGELELKIEPQADQKKQ